MVSKIRWETRRRRRKKRNEKGGKRASPNPSLCRLDRGFLRLESDRLNELYSGLGHASSESSPAPSCDIDYEKNVYAIYLYTPNDSLPDGYDSLLDYMTQVLSPVLGSDEAAQNAFAYVIGGIDGFAAELTPDQAELVKEQKGVLHVYDNRDVYD